MVLGAVLMLGVLGSLDSIEPTSLRQESSGGSIGAVALE